uniref:Uncharacterized protein n=1 Tax=Oryza sativa subsp. japonica TaxID=39947 RepID=Q6YYF4_ORYSJ|nr:hypothetical protein [Oryza sativa Japonica Group]BAD16274.1 hypothetical protein [Oryza sativa Japonica Group]
MGGAMATRLLLATGWVRGDRVRSHAGQGACPSRCRHFPSSSITAAPPHLLTVAVFVVKPARKERSKPELRMRREGERVRNKGKKRGCMTCGPPHADSA